MGRKALLVRKVIQALKVLRVKTEPRVKTELQVKTEHKVQLVLRLVPKVQRMSMQWLVSFRTSFNHS